MVKNGSDQTALNGAKRDSSIELLRIITMICIVAHHYVVNSGVLQEITPVNVLSLHSLFALLFGWGGKTGINCFVLITGYFMCKSKITVKKFMKLLLEIEFYKILLYFIFLAAGYIPFSFGMMLKSFLPVYGIGVGFTGSYLVFFLFLPYLKLMVHSMNEKQHLILIGLCVFIGSILQTFFDAPAAFTYVGWFVALFFISSYIRMYPESDEINKILAKIHLYPKNLFDNKRIWGYLTCVSLFLSWGSVILGAFIYHWNGQNLYYYFVSDSNKILALITAFCSFCYVKNIRMRYHPIINKVAASTYGVLLIHANSDVMRQWLWQDTLNNVKAYHSNYFVFHAAVSVAIIYVACTVIDMLRIEFVEKPFFKYIVDKRQ